jgi:formylglycine-generating enzyme required for sulfatase activity
MRLSWNYALNGLAGTNAVDISVLGIEMVYCCTGTFSLGSGTDSGTFFEAPSSNLHYRVQSEGAIPYGTTAGYLCHASNISLTWGDLVGPIPDAFPKGYRAFYCMKYEISQGQYTDFLQLLDAGLALTNFPNKAGNSRHTIGWNGSTYTNGAPDRACNFLTWANIRTYLDWAGLRPMTELEFEKICRGSLEAVASEFAWGDAASVKANGFLGSDGSGSETASPTNAILFGDNGYTLGPARVGIFATTTSSRRDAGAAYCGDMEMSGNLWEIIVTPCHAAGRLFTDTPGDGNPVTEPESWPTLSLAGLGVRGGGYEANILRCHISDRLFIRDPSYYTTAYATAGGRGVRTAP